MAAHLASFLPGWLQEPTWLRPLTHAIRLFILNHQAGGLFFVIFLEELGVPLPAPGDAAIAYGGYLTTTGAIPYPFAYVAVVRERCWEVRATSRSRDATGGHSSDVMADSSA